MNLIILKIHKLIHSYFFFIYLLNHNFIIDIKMKYYCKPNKDEEKEKTINVQLDEFFHLIYFTLFRYTVGKVLKSPIRPKY